MKKTIRKHRVLDMFLLSGYDKLQGCKLFVTTYRSQRGKTTSRQPGQASVDRLENLVDAILRNQVKGMSASVSLRTGGIDIDIRRRERI